MIVLGSANSALLLLHSSRAAKVLQQLVECHVIRRVCSSSRVEFSYEQPGACTSGNSYHPLCKQSIKASSIGPALIASLHSTIHGRPACWQDVFSL